MSLEPQRYKYYRAQLSELLYSTIIHIRNYNDLFNREAPQLIAQANRLWELSQRQRLVAGNRQHKKLAEIADKVAEFEQETNALTEELGDAPKSQLSPLDDWCAWLSRALNVLQTQAKYLELHSRSMLPKLMQASTVQQFKEDLQLPAHYEACFRMGLATAERRPELLPLTMAT